MPDQLTTAFFISQLQSLETRLREAIECQGRELKAALESHIEEDRDIAKAVLEIQTERRMEAKQAAKQSGLIALVVSAGLSGLMEMAKRVFR